MSAFGTKRTFVCAAVMSAFGGRALAELDQEPDVHERKLQEAKPEVEDGPEGETSLELLQTVYRDRKQPLNVRVRCAVEALAHEYPRVSAVAVTSMSGQSFAEALEPSPDRNHRHC